LSADSDSSTRCRPQRLAAMGKGSGPGCLQVDNPGEHVIGQIQLLAELLQVILFRDPDMAVLK